MSSKLKSLCRASSGKSEIIVMAIIGLIIAVAITYFLLQIIGHSEEHVEKVKKAKIFYRESLTWRPDSKLCEKRILEDLNSNPSRKEAKYRQLTLSSKALEYIGRMSQLQILELNESKFDPDDLRFLTKLPLRSLVIYGTPVNDECIKYIVKLKKLEKVELGDTGISDQGLKELTKAQTLVAIDLELAKNITDNGVRELVKLDNLDTLNLSFTNITNKSLVSIAEMKNMRRLRIKGIKLKPKDFRNFRKLKLFHLLFVNESNIDDSHLTEIGKLSTLMNLDLSMNNITDSGLLHLKNLSRLNFLVIKNCPELTVDGVNKIKELLPKCKVRFKSSKLLDIDVPEYELKQEVKLFQTRELNKQKKKVEGKDN